MKVYVRSNGGNNIILLNGTRESFRCRQRNKLHDGTPIPSLRFVSYKEMLKEIKKKNKTLIGPLQFNTMSKL